MPVKPFFEKKLIFFRPFSTPKSNYTRISTLLSTFRQENLYLLSVNLVSVRRVHSTTVVRICQSTTFL